VRAEPELPPATIRFPLGGITRSNSTGPLLWGWPLAWRCSRSGSNSAWAVVVLNRSAGLAMPSD